MTWFDLVTPKSVMFFKPFIDEIRNRGREVLITAREGEGYSEVVELLRLYKMPFFNRGSFGGGKLSDKLKASIERQFELMEFIEEHKVKRLVCLCSVDANRVAFGLGIPIINFYDIPLSDYTTNFYRALPQARLTLPLSTRAFRPFMVPEEIFLRFGLEKEQIFEYQFLDVVAWLRDFEPSREFYENVLREYELDPSIPTVVIREEEFKASYVKQKFPILYDGVKELLSKMHVNVLVIPRYEPEGVAELLPFAKVLKEKMVIQHLLAHCDLFIGGGGTLNSEACYFGTPTISTRSFVSHYDKFLIDAGLMEKVDTKEELASIAQEIMGRRNPHAQRVFGRMNIDIPNIIDEVLR
ncbi:MAG: DUF354 domain-containing protein [Wolinella sp.]